MLVDFNVLPEDARIWIYQSNRELTSKEVSEVSLKLAGFVNSWRRHGEDLKASFTIKYNQFIIFGIDKSFNDVSGCSIDASVHTIKLLEEEFDLDLMNKLNVAFRIGDKINIVSLAGFQNLAKDDKITSETKVFNNMIQSKLELTTNWEVPASKSWHHRFLKKVNS